MVKKIGCCCTAPLRQTLSNNTRNRQTWCSARTESYSRAAEQLFAFAFFFNICCGFLAFWRLFHVQRWLVSDRLSRSLSSVLSISGSDLEISSCAILHATIVDSCTFRLLIVLSFLGRLEIGPFCILLRKRFSSSSPLLDMPCHEQPPAINGLHLGSHAGSREYLLTFNFVLLAYESCVLLMSVFHCSRVEAHSAPR